MTDSNEKILEFIPNRKMIVEEILIKKMRLKGPKLYFVFALAANIIRTNDLIFNLKQWLSLQWNKIYFSERKKGRLLLLSIYDYNADKLRR